MAGGRGGLSETALWDRFDQAIKACEAHIFELREQVSRLLGILGEEEGAIFHAHLTILEDQSFQEKIRTEIRQGVPVSRAVAGVARACIEIFQGLEDPYLRERALDVQDVAQRVIRHLQGEAPGGETHRFDRPTVVVAEDLTRSQFVRLLQPNLAGIVLASGGGFSHTSILCRSAGLPAIVGVGPEAFRVPSGQPVMLDGGEGVLYLSPAASVLREYHARGDRAEALEAEVRSHLAEGAVTRDGKRITLFGNATLPADIERILDSGAPGWGCTVPNSPF